MGRIARAVRRFSWLAASLALALLAGDLPAEEHAALAPLVAAPDEPLRTRAGFLVAQSFWNRGEPAQALPRLAEIVAAAGTPADVLAGALIRQAACLWSLDRAALLALGPEEAAWGKSRG